VAVVFNPLVPLLGGEQAYGDRRAIHRAVAGYHRMFFERNISVDFPSARADADGLREQAGRAVSSCSPPTADTPREGVAQGGRLVEARPGWQTSAATPRLWCGIGWHRMRVREIELPRKQADAVGRPPLPGTTFAERFERIDSGSRVATFDDGQPAVHERAHERKALLPGHSPAR
jgi:hypothetical protein